MGVVLGQRRRQWRPYCLNGGINWVCVCVCREKRNEKEGRDKKRKKVRSKRTGVKTTIICCRWKGNCLVVGGGGATIGWGGRKDVAAATCHPDQRTVTLLRLQPRGLQDARARQREKEKSGPVKGAKCFSHVLVVAFPPQRSILLYYYFIVVETRQWRPHVFLTYRKKRIFLFVILRRLSSVVIVFRSYFFFIMN